MIPLGHGLDSDECINTGKHLVTAKLFFIITLPILMKLSHSQACAGRSAVLEVVSVKHQQIYRKVLSHRLHTELCSNPLRLRVLSFCRSNSVEVRHSPRGSHKGHTSVTDSPQQQIQIKADANPAFVALMQTARVRSHTRNRQKCSVKLIKSARRVQKIRGNSSKQMQPKTYQVRKRSVITCQTVYR